MRECSVVDELKDAHLPHKCASSSPLIFHIYASVNQVSIGLDNGLLPIRHHYLNQYWVIVNWPLRNKLQWNFNHHTKLFIYKNASENIVCEIAAILSRVRWVNVLPHLNLGLVSCSPQGYERNRQLWCIYAFIGKWELFFMMHIYGTLDYDEFAITFDMGSMVLPKPEAPGLGWEFEMLDWTCGEMFGHPADPGKTQLNRCWAEFVFGNTKIYLHFLSFLDSGVALIIEILNHGKQGLVYPA